MVLEPGPVVNGPGVIRAAQEAIAAKKVLALVIDRDSSGDIIRVGYFLEDRRGQRLVQPDVTWFDPSEIQFSGRLDPSRQLGQGSLHLEYDDPRGNVRQTTLEIQLDKEGYVMLRSLFRIHRNSVTGFVIQVETHNTRQGEVKRRPVLRYDCAHGFIHRDMISSRGHKSKKKLRTQNVREAITQAMEEIRDNLNPWLEQLGYKALSPHLLDQPHIVKEMDNARDTLLELHDKPHKMGSTKSRSVIVTDVVNQVLEQ
jgi:hypothetical protein